jgi:hypothetical protein
MPFDVNSAYDALKTNVMWSSNDVKHKQLYNFPDLADLGRRMEGYIVANDITQELNVWHEKEYCEYLLTNENK